MLVVVNFTLKFYNQPDVSNSMQQRRLPHPSPESPALAQLRTQRIELERTRTRLFLLRTEVDSLIGSNPLVQNNSHCIYLPG